MSIYFKSDFKIYMFIVKMLGIYIEGHTIEFNNF